MGKISQKEIDRAELLRKDYFNNKNKKDENI